MHIGIGKTLKRYRTGGYIWRYVVAGARAAAINCNRLWSRRNMYSMCSSSN
jgi:hypothetical protein